jgi:hypothetical protein
MGSKRSKMGLDDNHNQTTMLLGITNTANPATNQVKSNRGGCQEVGSGDGEQGEGGSQGLVPGQQCVKEVEIYLEMC